MKLVFDIVKSGRNIPSHRNFHFDMGGGTIGRSETCDWVLSDAQNYISGHHLSIIFMDDIYFMKDESTNGTFLKHPYKKLPKGHPVKINASDIFVIGDHEIQARYSYDEYAEDDIIGSINKSQAQENIIPNDDFIFESKADSFGEIDSSTEDDIFDLFNDSEQEKEVFDDIFDTVEVSEDDELLGSTIPEEAIGDDFNEIIDIEHEVDARIEPLHAHFDIPLAQDTTAHESPIQEVPRPSNGVSSGSGVESSLRILQDKLGIDLLNVSGTERDQMMVEIGDIILKTLDNLGSSVQIKEKTKQDLRLSAIHQDTQTNNPIMLGRSATKLLQPGNSAFGMMKLSDAIEKSLSEINQHSVALHGATKNMMKVTAKQFAPKSLEHRFESSGALRGVLPKPAMMWKAYSEMFDMLHENPAMGVDMIANDFSEEYENIAYSIQLSHIK